MTTDSPSETSMGTHMEPVEGDFYTDDEDDNDSNEDEEGEEGKAFLNTWRCKMLKNVMTTTGLIIMLLVSQDGQHGFLVFFVSMSC